jgi:hypothetical protein
MSTPAPDDAGAPGPAEARSGESSELGEDETSQDLAPSEMEPRDFWEDHNAKQQLARFDSQSGGMQMAQAMPMLVAVRMRPMWEKEQEAGDYNCIRILDGKVVIVLDPWYDPELNKNREREKRYAFDKVFDEQVRRWQRVGTSLRPTHTARGPRSHRFCFWSPLALLLYSIPGRWGRTTCTRRRRTGWWAVCWTGSTPPSSPTAPRGPARPTPCWAPLTSRA